MTGMHVLDVVSGKDCMYHVAFLCSGCKVLGVYSNQLMLISSALSTVFIDVLIIHYEIMPLEIKMAKTCEMRDTYFSFKDSG